MNFLYFDLKLLKLTMVIYGKKIHILSFSPLSLFLLVSFLLFWHWKLFLWRERTLTECWCDMKVKVFLLACFVDVAVVFGGSHKRVNHFICNWVHNFPVYWSIKVFMAFPPHNNRWQCVSCGKVEFAVSKERNWDFNCSFVRFIHETTFCCVICRVWEEKENEAKTLMQSFA